jgi:hypothetical protein
VKDRDVLEYILENIRKNENTSSNMRREKGNTDVRGGKNDCPIRPQNGGPEEPTPELLQLCQKSGEITLTETTSPKLKPAQAQNTPPDGDRTNPAAPGFDPGGRHPTVRSFRGAEKNPDPGLSGAGGHNPAAHFSRVKKENISA